MSKVKRLSKKFVCSRIKIQSALPTFWHVSKILDQKYGHIDLRVSEIEDFAEQCGFLFDVSYSRNISTNSQEEMSLKQSSRNFNESDEWFKNPSWILKLDLSLNNLKNLTLADLDAFRELRSIDLSMNRIETFSGISACPQLTSLCLAYNNIVQIPLTALQHLKQLNHLDLRSNLLSDLNHLPTLPNLEKLNVSYNNLTTLDGLQSLRSLRVLNCQFNKLSNIFSLSACSNLQHVDISHNCLSEPQDIVEVLRHLAYLTELNMAENWFVSDAKYLEVKLLENSSVKLLNGINIHTYREQVNNLPGIEPPLIGQQKVLKNKLKDAIREAMAERLHEQQTKHESSMRYFHKKILTMIIDMSSYKERNKKETEAWCSYIDTLSQEKAEGFSVNKIRALALIQADGTVANLDKEINKVEEQH